MPTDHVVSQGECVVSIALAHGMTPKKVWDLPRNRHLHDRKCNAVPETLEPGQVLHLPDPEPAHAECASEQRHVFRRNGQPVRVRVRFLDAGEPRDKLAYTFEIDGQTREGKLDADGTLEELVPPDAQSAIVRFGTADEPEVHRLRIGWLDPLDTVSGCQARLNNLGYHAGRVDGVQGPITNTAVRAFQRDSEIQVDGVVGPQTRGALLDAHGS